MVDKNKDDKEKYVHHNFYLEEKISQAIDDYLYKIRRKDLQNCYRKIVDYGFEQFQKEGGK